MGADWDGYRESFPEDWALEADNPIAMELSARYWYSIGQQRMSVNGGSYQQDDTSHLGELVLRIEDTTDHWYTKGIAGYSAVITNTFATPTKSGTLNSGSIKYFGADIGYMPLGNEMVSGGGFVGYQYWGDSPDIGPIGNTPSDVYYHMIRVGLAGKVKFGDMFDVTAEAAVIPAALVGGTYADSSLGSGQMGGWVYGAAGEAMARVHPAPNWSLGLGGRAWYLTGQPTAGGAYANNFSHLRYGLLAEIGAKF